MVTAAFFGGEQLWRSPLCRGKLISLTRGQASMEQGRDLPGPALAK